MMKCNAAVALIHDYLDGDLPREQTKNLQSHLSGCADCQSRLDSLERTDALLSAMPTPLASAGFSARLIKAMPKSRRPVAWTRWVRRHPAVSAAAMFLVIMLSSFVAMWNQDRQLSVSGPDLDHVVISGDTVTVPAGERYDGDLTVKNGKAVVKGDLQGNLTVIGGSVTLASTAHIAGDVKKVDRALDWVWYKVTSWFGTIAYGS
jgi:anti-sigma factor RsiW